MPAQKLHGGELMGLLPESDEEGGHGEKGKGGQLAADDRHVFQALVHGEEFGGDDRGEIATPVKPQKLMEPRAGRKAKFHLLGAKPPPSFEGGAL